MFLRDEIGAIQKINVAIFRFLFSFSNAVSEGIVLTHPEYSTVYGVVDIKHFNGAKAKGAVYATIKTI